MTVKASRPRSARSVDALDLGERDEFAIAGPRAGLACLRPRHGRRAAGIERARGTSRSPATSRTAPGCRPRPRSRRRSCLALLAVAEARPDRTALAKLCSRVENDWVGAETGLLDQLASLLGREGHALRIDFATLALEPVPLELGGWQLVTVESGADAQPRGLRLQRAPGRVPRRVRARSASRRSARRRPGRGRRRCRPLDRRARHVLSARTRASTRPSRRCARATSRTVGRLLDASHASLRDDYESSVPEVEAHREGARRPPAPPARGWSAAASAARCWRSSASGGRVPERRRARRSRRSPPARRALLGGEPAAVALATARPRRRPGRRLAQRVGLVRPLPREVVVLAAEVAVGGGLLVDRPVQLEVLAEGARAQVEVLVDELRRSAPRPIFSVPNVSTITETGCATPIA